MHFQDLLYIVTFISDTKEKSRLLEKAHACVCSVKPSCFQYGIMTEKLVIREIRIDEATG